ncbi:unnamed protein product [Symbiodinium sp. CCMP2592]|nr:unnamed protein product [Symbiodinium sp. CCMP2592]
MTAESHSWGWDLLRSCRSEATDAISEADSPVDGQPESEQSPDSSPEVGAEESSERDPEDGSRSSPVRGNSGDRNEDVKKLHFMDNPYISGIVIFVILFDMVLLALEAEYSARHKNGLKDVPDPFMWANHVVVGVFALEMLCRLCGRQCRDVFFVVDLVVICLQFVDVVLSAVAQLGSEGHACLLIAQCARWFRIVRCLRVIPACTSTKVQMNLMKGASVPLVWTVLVLVFAISTVATMVKTVVADACKQPNFVGFCGEDFQSLWNIWYNVFMGTFGGRQFYDLVKPMSHVSVPACIILSVYMPLIYLMMPVLAVHLSQKGVEQSSADQVKEQLKQLFKEMSGGSDSIGLDEFTEIQKKFGQLDISTEDVRKQAQACHLFTLIDESGDQLLQEEEFINGMMRVRGTASNLKLREVQWETQNRLSQIHEMLESVSVSLKKLEAGLIQDN